MQFFTRSRALGALVALLALALPAQAEIAASEWTPASYTIVQDGHAVTITVPVTSLGTGTTTLYLMTGSGRTAENDVMASQEVTSTGTQTFELDFSDKLWGTAYFWSLKLVNGTDEEAVTNWPYASNGDAFYNKSFTIQDNSTYTWIGGSSGVWTNAACWNRTAVGNTAATDPAGYPVFGSTAAFAEAAGNDPVTVTLPATPGSSVIESTPPGSSAKSTAPCWVITTLNYASMKVPLTFTSETTDWTSHLHIRGQTQNTAIDLTFDHCAVWINQQRLLGASSVDANGKNSIYTFTRGTVADWSSIYPERPGVAIRIKDGAWLKVGNINTCGVSDADHPPIFEVEDAELRCGDKLAPDSNGTSGALYRLMGSHPKLEFKSCQTAKDNSTDVVEFLVPAGGYIEPPLHFWGNEVLNSSGKANLTLRIATNSPALFAGVATTTRFVNAKVVDGETAAKADFDLPTGVTTSTFTDPNGNADGYVVSIPAGPGPVLSDVRIANAGGQSFTIAGSIDLGASGNAATVTAWLAEDGGDFVAQGSAEVSASGAFRASVQNLTVGTAYRWYVEAVSEAGRHATVPRQATFRPGMASVSDASVRSYAAGNGERIYVFTNSLEVGSITFSQGGLVEVLVVGGGGAGGNTGGGGGGGAFLHRDDFIPAGTYEVAVGKGGYNTADSGASVAAGASSIGDIFIAPGGGAGGIFNNLYGTTLGGSGGGNGSKGDSAPQRGVWPFGTDGGATVGGNLIWNGSPGGGGAGGPGGDRRSSGGTYRGGYGGDGVACSITGESVIYAAGGGGGSGSTAAVLPGAAGLGGVPGAAYDDTGRHDAVANTGSGGGGGGHANAAKRGGSGGSGIVVVRVKNPAHRATVIIVK